MKHERYAIESWFFALPEVLERLIGGKLSAEQRELGELRPKDCRIAWPSSKPH